MHMYMYSWFVCLQAIHCCLDGLRGIEDDDEEKACETFEQFALNKTCVAQVMENSGTRVSVELIDTESDGRDTINSLLLQELCSKAKLTPILPAVSDLSVRGGGREGGRRKEGGGGGGVTKVFKKWFHSYLHVHVLLCLPLAWSSEGCCQVH